MNFDANAFTGFDWDEGNLSKIPAKHPVSNTEAEQMFANIPLLVTDDAGHSQNERRFRALGQTNEGRILHVSFTLRGDKVRIISARPANRKERNTYENLNA
ncbi:MAG: BrnT family toxin [Verrucomicrobiae bacterium]|nr:BrnT family toxin [Verrucomicrobiae bacterium]